MRVAIAGFALESASFLPGETGLDVFEREALRGPAMIEALRGQASVGGGFIEGLEAAGATIVPLVHSDAGAAGHASDAAFEAYSEEIVRGIADNRDRLDGALLFLHGAMTTPTRPDPEREIVWRVRRALGPNKPLVLACDLHANLSPETAAACDALFGYHHSPHVDMADTGLRAARCLVRTLRGEIRPRLAFEKVPVVLPSIATATSLEPLAGIVRASIEAPEHHAGVLDCSVFCGFAYADTPAIGFAVAAVSDDDGEAGRMLVHSLDRRIQEERSALLDAAPTRPYREAVDAALSVAGRASRPVVILEHADRVNDSTWVLRELVARGARRVAVPWLWDPKAAEAAVAAGAGAEMTLGLGGHSSPEAGGPVEVRARVLWAGHKAFVGTGPMRYGRRVDLGPSALLDISGIIVSVISHQTTAIDLDAFRAFDLDPHAFAIIVLRSKTHFRAVYEPLAETIIIADTPDWGRADLATLPYRHVPPGVFPLARG